MKTKTPVKPVVKPAIKTQIKAGARPASAYA